MRALHIIKCSDSLMWYADRVGRIVPFLWEGDTYYMSREPAGYTNIVLKQDAEFIEVIDETV